MFSFLYIKILPFVVFSKLMEFLKMNKEDYSIDISESQNGGSIIKLEISSRRTYLVAAIYNDQDHRIQKIVRWNVEEGKNINEENKDVEKGKDIEEDEYIEKFEYIKQKEDEINVEVELHDKDKVHICVSDDKILAYIFYRCNNKCE